MRENAAEKHFKDEWEYDLDVEVVDLDTPETSTFAEGVSESAHLVSKKSLSLSVVRWQHVFRRQHWRLFVVIGSFVLVFLLLFLNAQNIAFLAGKFKPSIATPPVHVQPKLAERVPIPLMINPSLVVSTKKLGFSCMVNEAWAPDSTAIVVQGFSKGCDNDASHALGYATVLDAHNGQLLASISLDTPIREAFIAHYPDFKNNYSLFYESTTWSPGKNYLAFAFTISAQKGNENANYIGVLIYDLHLKRSQVLMERNVITLTNQGQINTYTEWDVVQGSIVPTPTYTNSVTIPLQINIPPAERYTWGDHGKLLPQTTTVASPSSIGNTVGDASFSIWQPGYISIVKQVDVGGGIYTAGIFLWQANFMAWSPDGRYLVQNAYTATLLEPKGYPQPSENIINTYHLKNITVLPIRDSALLAALNFLNDASAAESDMQNILALAWSPNGKLMWMMHYGSAIMSLYDSQNGFLTALLIPQPTYNVNAQSEPSDPIWSPDGTKVVSQDSSLQTISFWTLPHSLQ